MNIDERIFGGFSLDRHSRSRRGRGVKLNLKAKANAGPGRVRLAVCILVPAVIAAVCALSWFGYRAVVGVLFSNNDLFTMTHLDIRGGHVVVRDYIRGQKAIQEGMNLFAFSTSELREEFLRQAPSFKSIEFKRRLPGTLIVEAVERLPLARIGRGGYLVVDGEGYVFSVGGYKGRLPEIHGYRGPKLKPGMMLQGPALEAVRVIEACRSSDLAEDVAIAAIDVSGGFGAREDSMRLTLAQGTHVLFWWKRSGTRSRQPPEDLLARLRFLRGVLRRAAEEDGRVPRLVDLTLDSYRRNIPVEF